MLRNIRKPASSATMAGIVFRRTTHLSPNQALGQRFGPMGCAIHPVGVGMWILLILKRAISFFLSGNWLSGECFRRGSLIWSYDNEYLSPAMSKQYRVS